MLKEFKNNPYFRFTFIAIILYVVWYVIYETWIHPMGIWDRNIIYSLVVISSSLLQFLGFDTYTAGDPVNIVGVDGTSGVIIGDACDGFSLFALFIVFMISYPGPWKQKLWFIPMGLLAIHLINAIRIAALAAVYTISREAVEFNHNYTFTIVVYSMVFLLWWIWAKKYAAPYLKDKKENVAK